MSGTAQLLRTSDFGDVYVKYKVALDKSRIFWKALDILERDKELKFVSETCDISNIGQNSNSISLLCNSGLNNIQPKLRTIRALLLPDCVHVSTLTNP